MASLFNFDDFWAERGKPVDDAMNDPRMWSPSTEYRNPLMMFGRGPYAFPNQGQQQPALNDPAPQFAGIPGTVGGIPRGQLPAMGPSMAQVHGGGSPQMQGLEAGQPAAPGFFDRLMSGLGANSNTLIGLGSDISKGGFTKGFAGALAGSGMDDKLRLSQLGSTDDIKEYNFARSQGFKGDLAEWMQRKRAGAGEYGMQGYWGVGADGKPALMQLGKGGTAVQSKLPEGFSLSKDPIKLDAGTHHILLDPVTRQTIGMIPKDIKGKESQEAEGKAEGEAKVGLPLVISNAERILKQIEEVQSHPAKPIGTGALLGRIPGIAGPQLDFVERTEQLKGQAFLQAYQTLRGGGAITEVEGKKGEQAIARLSRAKDGAAFDAALNDLKEVVATGVKNARAKAGQSEPVAPAATTTPSPKKPPPPKLGDERNGYRFKGGNPADKNSWEPII